MAMQTISVDHVASCLTPCGLGASVHLSPAIIAEEGYAVAVRVLEEKDTYNQVETVGGALHRLTVGDVLVGPLGERQALKGYSGSIPEEVSVGDVVHVLNMGGMVGICTSAHPDLGPALRVEVLGAVCTAAGASARPVALKDHAVAPVDDLPSCAPLVLVSGTAMNTGKTYAACKLIHGLTERGLRVAAIKLTGATLQRDVAAMASHGAVATASFTDAGVVSTTSKDTPSLAKGLLAAFQADAPDAIVAELGDGVIGPYGVDQLLLDPDLQQHTAAHVVAASDLAGAWAVHHLFQTRYEQSIAAFTGPVTDNAVGCAYLQQTLGTPGCNALHNPEALAQTVYGALSAVTAPPAPTPVAAPTLDAIPSYPTMPCLP